MLPLFYCSELCFFCVLVLDDTVAADDQGREQVVAPGQYLIFLSLDIPIVHGKLFYKLVCADEHRYNKHNKHYYAVLFF